MSSLSFHSTVTDVRPLVVLDPEDREQVERLIRLQDKHFNDGDARRTVNCDDLRDMQAALREFANPTPPKPAEPTGLGAVVEDADGRRWVLCPDGYAAEPWRGLARGQRSWSRIDAVRVLSEGVTNG